MIGEIILLLLLLLLLFLLFFFTIEKTMAPRGFTIEAAFFAHRNRDDILFRTGLVVEVVVHRVVPAEVVLVPLRLDDDGEPRVARDNLL